MPSARKFYHTVLQTEVLSEEPFQWENLEDVEHHITDGGCSGRTIATIDNKEKTGPEIAKLLLSQGTDPEFFGLTDAGEEVDISQVLARIEESGGPEPDDLICDQCQCKFPVPNNDDFSGGYYDCWDVDGHPSHHYDCCSAECEQKFMEGFEYCDKCKRYLHPLQENPQHPPRGSSLTEVPGSDDLVCRRCAESMIPMSKERAEYFIRQAYSNDTPFTCVNNDGYAATFTPTNGGFAMIISHYVDAPEVLIIPTDNPIIATALMGAKILNIYAKQTTLKQEEEANGDDAGTD